MVNQLPIFFSDARNQAQGGDLTYDHNGDIIIVITNALLAGKLNDCLKHGRQTNLSFTYEELDPAAPDPTHWVVFHYDMSEVAVFTNELDACRYAWRNSMRVAPYIVGEGIRETINRPVV